MTDWPQIFRPLVLGDILCENCGRDFMDDGLGEENMLCKACIHAQERDEDD